MVAHGTGDIGLTAGNVVALFYSAFALRTVHEIAVRKRAAREEMAFELDEEMTAELEEAYFMAWSLMLGLGMACAALLWALRGLTTAHLSRAGALISPSFDFWWLVALLMAPVLDCLAVNVMLRGRRATIDDFYRAFDDELVTPWRIPPLAYLSTLLACVALSTGLNAFASFTPERIAIRTEWSLRTAEHSYQDVRALYFVKRMRGRDGRIVSRPRFVVDFRSGQRWTTEDGWRRTDQADDRALIDDVSRRSGVEVREVDLLDESHDRCDPAANPAHRR